jgi:ATP-dependent RNA helicase DHX8/PRP22
MSTATDDVPDTASAPAPASASAPAPAPDTASAPAPTPASASAPAPVSYNADPEQDVEEDKDFDVLPVEAFKETILHYLFSSEHQVLICVGETGSGKTTKIPQIVLDSGLLSDKAGGADLSIVVTQPRRVGAMTVSQRVASERGGCLGEEVGYKVRFDDRTGPGTRIHFMTDGILVS